MQLVIVESPAKAKTIEKYLGKDFKVLASYGHIRDLPPKDGSVRPDEGFAMDWEIYSDQRKRSQVKAIADAAKKRSLEDFDAAEEGFTVELKDAGTSEMVNGRRFVVLGPNGKPIFRSSNDVVKWVIRRREVAADKMNGLPNKLRRVSELARSEDLEDFHRKSLDFPRISNSAGAGPS